MQNIEIHEANLEEKTEAFKNVHEVWGGGMPLEEYVVWRLQSVQHARARWFVLIEKGIVAASLGVYPLRLGLKGDVFDAVGIGAVHTRPCYRRKGHAEKLLNWVLELCEKENKKLAMLFSEIAPAYYEKFGFVQFVSKAFKYEVSAAEGLNSDLSVKEIKPLDHLEQLGSMYKKYNEEYDLWLNRDEEYWKWNLAVRSKSRFFLIETSKKQVGYLRVNINRKKFLLEDYALPSAEIAISVAAELAKSEGFDRVVGWSHRPLDAISGLKTKPRPDEITMVLALDKELKLRVSAIENPLIWSCDYF